MKIGNVIALVNRGLLAHDPPQRLPGGVTEANISAKLDDVLTKGMPGGRTTMRGGVVKKTAGKSLALAAGRKKPCPSPSAKRLQNYVSSLVAAGMPLDKAFRQAARLGVGGAKNA